MGKCKDCKWWELDQDMQDNGLQYGRCRRKAPFLLGMIRKYDDYDTAVLAEFPRTESECDWCGEFVDKEEKDCKDISISSLMLSRRSEKCLLSAGIKTVNQLKQKSNLELIKINGLGGRSLREIQRKLREFVND